MSDDDGLPPDAPYDAGDERSVKRRETKLKKEEREGLEFWRQVLGTPVGRREMWKVLNDDMHAFTVTFGVAGGMPQPEASFHAAGVQSAGSGFYHKLAGIYLPGIIAMHVENDARYPKEAV